MENELYKYIHPNPALNFVGIFRSLKGLMANCGTKEVL
jgi:hypothetical protein